MNLLTKYLHISFLTLLHTTLLQSSICEKGEDPFVLLDVYDNKVYADGHEITSSKVVAHYPGAAKVNITAFCIPSATRLIAVTNTILSFGVALIGSIEGKLVTNKDWKCVTVISDVDWYQVNYNDTKWPQALAFPRNDFIPNISIRAQDILPSSLSMHQFNYYCRAWIVDRIKSNIQEQLTRSAYASRVGRNQRLSFHLIHSFLVDDIFECVIHCLDYKECVSVNFENAKTKQFKRCELNSKTRSDIPGHVMLFDEEFDYYNIMKL